MLAYGAKTVDKYSASGGEALVSGAREDLLWTLKPLRFQDVTTRPSGLCTYKREP